MKKQKINVVTLGCSKNLVDSEVLLNQLSKDGFEVVHDSNDADSDIVVINTCGFIHDAKEESVNTILQFVDAKGRGDIDKLYVMGCLSERYKTDLEQEVPEVDKFFGKFDLKALVGELKATYRPEFIYERKITTPSHFAYLKISEGCNRVCAFCAIPGMTGKHVSKSMDDLVKEAKYLAKSGVKEILLIAQDLSYYGIDLYGKGMLAELIQKIAEVDGIEWIRLHYLYPTKFPMDILPLFKTVPKLCKYIDIPLQHSSNNVLKHMLRQVTTEETEALLQKIKEEVPGIAIRTTMLIGHPGETKEDFEQLKSFVSKHRFDRLGAFSYSHEEGTYGYKKYSDDIPEDVKQARVEELMGIQQIVSSQLNAERIGQTLKVIIDREDEEFYVGRTEFDSPEVDGEVLISKEVSLKKGQFCEVEITSSEEFDLYGNVV
ncbi:ribosomal protein S12p Asp88 methylthiotransferase [Aquipluma nitroreducens]|uniref:Ribosomal protein uS12 methylthiotransferase RimO n=1 Tax=Aquipluma nitroreducens TaxID=2010828 RepID=A0A5K7S4Y7_9BACT|nr:30S ribosomal protein S12 methylthiotransferase RimO [Aquipluma nitroreducens]BBE16569.1 ribosomal protein S12p Asp88 methylthiotransferase [Aquipluma nitroreducens]